MLAAFDAASAKIPHGLLQRTVAAGGEGADALAEHFASVRAGAVTVRFGAKNFLAYDTENQNPLLPRMFASVDDVYCLFQGHIVNILMLKQQYGLSKNVSEVMLVIEAYRTLRDRGPYPADQVVRDLEGKFAFVVFDSTSNAIFVAADADGSVPFFWGTDSGGHLLLCEDEEMIKKGCGKAFAPFPKGCFFTSTGGLQSFEHPKSEVKVIPRVDSKGEFCGATYEVEEQVKKDAGMPRVGSAADWSSQI